MRWLLGLLLRLLPYWMLAGFLFLCGMVIVEFEVLPMVFDKTTAVSSETCTVTHVQPVPDGRHPANAHVRVDTETCGQLIVPVPHGALDMYQEIEEGKQYSFRVARHSDTGLARIVLVNNEGANRAYTKDIALID